MNSNSTHTGVCILLALCSFSVYANYPSSHPFLYMVIHWITIAMFSIMTLYLCIHVKQLTRQLTSLRKLSLTDELTQLNNRRSLFEQAKREIELAKREGTPFTVASCDIDHFKNVNDSYGHEVGDNVLVWIANNLKHSIRGSDFVGRVGGEEFVILLPNTTCDAAQALIERICHNIGSSIITEHNISLSLSVGVACLDNTDSEFCEIMRRADKALYKAKNNGRNQIIQYKYDVESTTADSTTHHS